MSNTYTEKTITESMLSNEYADNGVIVKTESEAISLLKNKGFVLLDGRYRGKGGKSAIIYPVRDAILDTRWPHKPVKFFSRGFLVSFGGEPRSCYDLKFSKIKRPIF